MKIYEINYDMKDPFCGTTNMSGYVYANNKKEALQSAKKIIKWNVTPIKVLREIKTLN